MKHATSNFPVGARWEYIDERGVIYYIEFNRIHGKTEVWNFGRIYSDGSGHKFDWATSYRSAKRNHYTGGKFKRVK